MNSNLSEKSDSQADFYGAPQTTEILIDKLLNSLNELNLVIERKLEALATLDVTIQILDYKIYEATLAFKQDINNVKDERNRILISIENRSELSLILNDLDRRILELEQELDEKVKKHNEEKIELQKECELLMFQMDEDLAVMQTQMADLRTEIQARKADLFLAQIILLEEKYDPQINHTEATLATFEKLQTKGWKLDQQENKLAEILETQGLSFTPSGRLLTVDGNCITFQEAQDRGYFHDVSVSLEQIFKFVYRQEAKPQISPIGTITSQESITGRKASPDVKYLKEFLGKPLTLALAEITAKHPKDPVHYLGHYLFKYRYNQELEETDKAQLTELNRERKRLAEERWKQFIQDESRNAVIDMVLRAEQIAYENEIKRIQEEQLEEEVTEELLEEAKDTFE